jgi:hypothetical protein
MQESGPASGAPLEEVDALDDEVLDDEVLDRAPPLPKDASSSVRAPQPTPLVSDTNHANRSTPGRSMSRRIVGAGPLWELGFRRFDGPGCWAGPSLDSAKLELRSCFGRR